MMARDAVVLVLLAVAGAAAAGAAATPGASIARARPPHVVFLLADDLGWNNVGWHSNITLTPHLDALADGGIRLGQHYAQRWCAPSRAALMTGRYPYNTGMMNYGHGQPKDKYREELSAVPTAFPMLPAMLKHAPVPYATHHVGKWHLGFFSHAHTPHGRGFDSSFGFMLGDSRHDNRSSQVTHTCGLPVTDLFNTSHIANDTAYYRNNEYSSYMYANEARRIIAAHDADAAPLFLYMAFQNTHAPYQSPQCYRDRYPALPKGESQRCFNAMASALDDAVGAIVRALHEANMYDNCVIIFTSDNGGPARRGNNMPLRGAKFSVFEGGMRTAAVVHSPLLPAATTHTTSDALIHLSDWYATILALAGVDPAVVANASGPVPPDAFNIWPALADPAVASPRTMIVHEYDDVQGIYAVRSGAYKLMWGNVGVDKWIPDVSYTGGGDPPCTALLPPTNETATSLISSWSTPVVVDRARSAAAVVPDAGASSVTSATLTRKHHHHHGHGGGGSTCTAAKPCLFDVLADPTERTDLAASRPAVVARLRRELDAYVANRWRGQLDTAAGWSEERYCAWIQRVGWVQPFENDS